MQHHRRAPLGPAGAGLAAAVLGLALAACGGGPGQPTGPASSLPPDAVALTAIEYEFTPSSATVPAGSVTFAVTNGGRENHEFEVLSGETSLGKIDAFGGGTTKTLTVDLEAGAYTFACRLNGHDILGMEGTLTVNG